MVGSEYSMLMAHVECRHKCLEMKKLFEFLQVRVTLLIILRVALYNGEIILVNGKTPHPMLIFRFILKDFLKMFFNPFFYFTFHNCYIIRVSAKNISLKQRSLSNL